MIYDLCARIPNIILTQDKVYKGAKSFWGRTPDAFAVQGAGEFIEIIVDSVPIKLLYIHKDNSPCVFESEILKCDYDYSQQIIFEMPKDASNSLYNTLTRFCKYLCDRYICPMLLTLDFDYEVCYMEPHTPVLWSDSLSSFVKF